MTGKSKDFDFNTAYFLFHSYKQTGEKAKAQFIYQLIELQDTLSPKSIANTDILLNRHYNIQTVESVLSDLNYSLVSFKRDVGCTFLGIPIQKFTIISFT